MSLALRPRAASSLLRRAFRMKVRFTIAHPVNGQDLNAASHERGQKALSG